MPAIPCRAWPIRRRSEAPGRRRVSSGRRAPVEAGQQVLGETRFACIRLERDLALQMPDALVLAMQREVDSAKVIVNAIDVWIGGERLVQRRDGVSRAAGAEQRPAVGVERIGVSGPESQRLFREPDRI